MKPTVSQLIDLLNKPALLKWANKIGLEGIPLDQYRKKYAGDGDNIHKQIENDFKHGITFSIANFQAFKSRYEFVESEPVIEDDLYKGRADVILRRNGVKFLFDFKSSNAIYFEQKLQAIAYKRVLDVQKVGIVNTTYFTESIIEVTPAEEIEYGRIINALVAIWHAKKTLGV